MRPAPWVAASEMLSPAKFFTVFTLAAALSGCWVKKTMCRGLHNAMPGTCRAFTESSEENSAGENSASTNTVVSAGGATSAQVADGFSLARLAPEQLSNDIDLALAFGASEGQLRHFEPALGQTLDYLVIGFGVPLGGIDFNTASKRDPATRAQTLLVARVVAWQLASASVWTDHDRNEASRQIFNKCEMETDRPYMDDADDGKSDEERAAIRAGETRWKDQVEELFFRLYSRPPMPDELAAVRTAFVTTIKNEGYPPMGWIIVLYSMLASEEFWHL